ARPRDVQQERAERLPDPLLLRPVLEQAAHQDAERGEQQDGGAQPPAETPPEGESSPWRVVCGRGHLRPPFARPRSAPTRRARRTAPPSSRARRAAVPPRWGA